MAAYGPAQCCTIGVKHSGDATGKMVKVAGRWDAYVATPPADKTHAGAGILYMPDVIGIWQNSKLMADQFAANGYLTMIIDEFNGDALQLNRPAGYDFETWRCKGSDGQNPHTPEAVEPIIEAAIKCMKEEYSVTKLGAAGYCFGAKYVTRHLQDGEIKVGYLAHPTMVTEDEFAAIGGPLSIAAAETDSIFPAENRHKCEDILKATGHPYQINLYSGVAHGFSVRCDPSVKIEKFAKEQAFLQAVAWFDFWLVEA